MNKGGKIAIGLIGLAGLGVAGYFLWKYFQNKGNNGFSFDPASPGLTPGTTTATSTPSYTGSTSGSSAPNGVDTLDFQQYVINTKGDKSILGGGGASGYGDDGVWGSKTQKAWEKYGGDYATSQVTEAAQDLSETVVNAMFPTVDQGKANYSDVWYEQQADKLYTAMDGMGTDESTIGQVFAKFKSDKDYWNTKSAFGTRDGYNLSAWLRSELTSWQVEKYLNKPMAANGLTVEF